MIPRTSQSVNSSINSSAENSRTNIYTLKINRCSCMNDRKNAYIVAEGGGGAASTMLYQIDGGQIDRQRVT